MLDTSGPSSADSSPSATLQQSLENRLQARMAGYGSPEYVLTWKHWDMQSGVPICAQRASVRRTSDSGFTGWPTPQVFDRSNEGQGRALRYKGDSTERTGEYPQPGVEGQLSGDLKDYAMLAGWPTPNAPRAHDSDASAYRWNPNKKQDDPVNLMLGRTATLSSVPMEGRAALAPEFSRWLMGYPEEWDASVPTVTPSSRRSQRSS